MKKFHVTFEPANRNADVDQYTTILEAAALVNITLNTACGGRGTCGKCAVYIDGKKTKVNACQYQIKSNLSVIIPQESLLETTDKILGESCKKSVETQNVDVYRQYEKNAANEILGAAVDVGTTTVVAKLVNLKNGQTLATEAILNPQIKFGDNVIDRISAACDPNELRHVILDCVNDLIAKLIAKQNVTVNDLYEVCVVGNTAMNHIFLGLPTESLGQAPYKPFAIKAFDLTPQKAEIVMNPKGNVHAVENIAGFVGADTVAAALATKMDSAEQIKNKNVLLVDIGTNGEIVLACGGQLYAASCAAGPAFEGAGIGNGSRAIDGAIEAVEICEGGADIKLKVIGNSKPRSICGSGLIDAIAVMKKIGAIGANGRFVDESGLVGMPEKMAKRVVNYGGQPVFILADKVVITQKDVRAVQLAKAAIKAAINMMLDERGIKENQLDKVLLAGGFGNYIKKSNAIAIKMLPDIECDKIEFVANAALAGGCETLVSTEARLRAKEMASRIDYIEIAMKPKFIDFYTDAMMF